MTARIHRASGPIPVVVGNFNMNGTTFDSLMAEKFIKVFFKGLRGLIEVRYIAPDGPVRTSFHNNRHEALLACWGGAERFCNVYLGLATRRDNTSGGRDNLHQVRAVWIDFDGDRDELHAKLERFPLAPSVRVFTGGGEHVYWLFEKPLDVSTPDGCDAHEQVLRALRDHFSSDNVVDAPRILRVPGSFNFPDAKKCAKGRTVAPCTVMELDEDVHYTLSDFADFVKMSKTTSSKTRNATTYKREPWNGKVPTSVGEALAISGKARRRFDRDTDGLTDTSPSGVDFSLACIFAVIGLSGAEIEAGLRASRAKAGVRDKHDGYFQLTTEKAIDCARVAA